MPTEPTPRPWRQGARYQQDIIGADGTWVATTYGHSDPALIVRAVNAHDELLALGDELIECLTDERDRWGSGQDDCWRERRLCEVRIILDRIRNS